MSTPVWCELVCDNCGAKAGGRFVNKAQIPINLLKDAARKQGWIVHPRGTVCVCSNACANAAAHMRLRQMADSIGAKP